MSLLDSHGYNYPLQQIGMCKCRSLNISHGAPKSHSLTTSSTENKLLPQSWPAASNGLNLQWLQQSGFAFPVAQQQLAPLASPTAINHEKKTKNQDWWPSSRCQEDEKMDGQCCGEIFSNTFFLSGDKWQPNNEVVLTLLSPVALL